MAGEVTPPRNAQGPGMHSEHIIFWNSEGRIVPHLLYDYLGSIGIGNYYPDNFNNKNSNPIIVMVRENIVSPVNVGYLLNITKSYIIEHTERNGNLGSILDSLHSKTSLFSDKNLLLLPTLKLEFINDTADIAFFFFRNGIVKVSKENIQLCNYNEFEQHVWEKNIIPIDFVSIDFNDLEHSCDFMKFCKDLTYVEDNDHASSRFKALSTAIGYLLHRHKNPATTKAVILMDVYINGTLNGGSGKTLLIIAIGKVRNLYIIDGKKYDQKEWFGLSGVELNTEVLLFDDIVKNFDFEMIFPLMTTGLQLKRKYKNDLFLSFDRSPKVAITTNYAINGDSSSYRRRMYEFEVSATYSSEYSPRDKFGKNFFDGWDVSEWIHFYNTMFHFLKLYLNEGLLESEPINIQLTKLINKTCEEFWEWANQNIAASTQYNKNTLFDNFLNIYPEFKARLRQRVFTNWLRIWGEFKKLKVLETHSDNVRYIKFINQS